MAESGGLENRCVRKGTVGSNPTPSANKRGARNGSPLQVKLLYTKIDRLIDWRPLSSPMMRYGERNQIALMSETGFYKCKVGGKS